MFCKGYGVSAAIQDQEKPCLVFPKCCKSDSGRSKALVPGQCNLKIYTYIYISELAFRTSCQQNFVHVGYFGDTLPRLCVNKLSTPSLLLLKDKLSLCMSQVKTQIQKVDLKQSRLYKKRMACLLLGHILALVKT